MFVKALSIGSQWAIPIFIIFVVVHGHLKGVKIFEAFVEGAQEGFSLAVKIIPYVVGIFVAVGIFRESGAMEFLAEGLKPALTLLRVPAEVLPLMIVRPLSGPAALALTVEIMESAGPDSFVGRLASTMMGSCDTTFYILALYFASVGVKNSRYAVPVGLLADLAGFSASVYICWKVFG